MFSCASDHDLQAVGSSGCACCNPLVRSASRRIEAGLSRRGFVAGAGASLASLGLAPRVGAQTPDPTPPIVFTNFLIVRRSVLRIAHGAPPARRGGSDRGDRGRRSGRPGRRAHVDCGGRIDHAGPDRRALALHLRRAAVSTLFSADLGYIFLAASAEAERTLMRGFTTVRDLGGPSFALKQAIDDGLVHGPRIYPVRRHDHHDGRPRRLRPLSDLPRSPGGPVERHGAERRREYRRQRRRGAPARARATPAGGVPDQARGRRRRVVAAHHARHVDVQRARAAGRRGGGRRPEHLRRRRTPIRPPPSGGRSPRACNASNMAISWTRRPRRLMADKGVWLSIQPFLGEDDTAR